MLRTFQVTRITSTSERRCVFALQEYGSMKLEELNEASPAGAGTHHSAAVDAGGQGWSLSS